MLSIKSPQKKDEKYWIDCRVNSLRQFLLYYGIDIPRNYVFLLSEAYTYYYMYTNFEEANVFHIPFVAASESSLEDKLFRALGFQYVTERLDESTDSFDKMKDLIYSQRPVLMHTVEQMFVKHVEVFEKLKVNLRMQSIPILIGIDEKDNYILYWISSGQKEPIMVRNKKEIDRLRSIECAPYPPDYWCTYIAKQIPNISKHYLIEKLHQAVKNITRKMLYGVQIDSQAIKNLNATEAYIGLEAINKMNAALQQMLYYMSKHPEDMEYKKKSYLSILIAKIGLFKGSKSAFRKEFGDALCQLADETSNKNLSEIGLEFIEITRSWRRLFLQISKIEHKNFSVESLFELCDIFNHIYETEFIAFQKLAKYYEISEEDLC